MDTGMSWRLNFKVKDLLSEDDSDANAVLLGRKVAARLRDSAVFNPHHAHKLERRFKEVTSVHEFNNVMDELYDIADAQRVWIE